MRWEQIGAGGAVSLGGDAIMSTLTSPDRAECAKIPGSCRGGARRFGDPTACWRSGHVAVMFLPDPPGRFAGRVPRGDTAKGRAEAGACSG